MRSTLTRLPRSTRGYVLSVLLVSLAILLTFAIRPVFGGKAPLLFFTIAVALSASYGGLLAGVFTTFLSVVMAGWLFEHSIFLLTLSQSSLVLFAVLGVTISAIIQLLHRANANVVAARTQLELANEELSRSNEELQRFAYAVSHDLQAPLRNIKTLTALLVRRNGETLDRDSKECAHMIIGGVQRMEFLIKGLLDYAAATADKHHSAASNSHTVLEQVLQNLRYLIDAENAVITFDALPIVQANEDRLAQVFSNIITNAIKYRNNRKPEIHISVTDNGTEWVFKVTDNGIGIDMNYANEIFGLFKRRHSSDEYEGNGIGLAICKAVIERRGGRIWVESELGKGSTFFFTIPKITAEHSKKPGASATEPIVKSKTVEVH
ncbi:MAG TPA: ATP-binding protein [Bryobacteraceae bacterium]|nr:ATP-binding protein [Bryobacteraceae bacterium]